MLGQLLQGAIDRGEAVEQADREDHEEDLERPQADDLRRAQAHAETADQIGKGDGEKADVDLGLVTEGHGDDDGRDDEHAHHVESVLLLLCKYQRERSKPNSFAGLSLSTWARSPASGSSASKKAY
ncbi:hypothetical protein D3C73_1377570 [compost metagenome]